MIVCAQCGQDAQADGQVENCCSKAISRSSTTERSLVGGRYANDRPPKRAAQSQAPKLKKPALPAGACQCHSLAKEFWKLLKGSKLLAQAAFLSQSNSVKPRFMTKQEDFKLFFDVAAVTYLKQASPPTAETSANSK